MKERRVVVISGGSSGIGKSIASVFSEAGDIVYSLSRTGKSSPGITSLSTDVTSAQSVDHAVDMIIRQEKRIDILINCAGYGISGAIEFTDIEDSKQLFETDFWGMVRLNAAVIPYMRTNNSGLIINISSVAAILPIPFQAYYSAAKAAVTNYTLSLANELKPFSIHVCAVQPGDVSTGFTSARKKSTKGDDVYNGRIHKSVGRMESDEQNGMDPDVIARSVMHIAERTRIHPVYTAGVKYRFFILLARVLPFRFVNWVLYQLYAK